MKTLDNATMASNPGGLVLSREKYALYFGRNAADRWLYRFCAGLPWAARILPLGGARVRHWTRTREHLEHGCLGPAAVIDPDKGLIAAFSSLTAQGETPTPVVKIFRERLDLVDPLLVRKGARLAVACIFWSTEESMARGCWSDFSPIVINCLVDDPGSGEAAKARIKPLAWEVLGLGLAKLQGRRQVGLYPVDVPLDMAWDAF